MIVVTPGRAGAGLITFNGIKQGQTVSNQLAVIDSTRLSEGSNAFAPIIPADNTLVQLETSDLSNVTLVALVQ